MICVEKRWTIHAHANYLKRIKIEKRIVDELILFPHKNPLFTYNCFSTPFFSVKMA